jgi:hypothetical protein
VGLSAFRGFSARRFAFAIKECVPDLIDGLEEAIRKHCTDAMREHYEGDMAALELRALVQDYVTWRHRFPSARPRKVHESDTLAKSDLSGRYAGGLAAIKRDIEAGADLTPYLSSLVRFAHGRDRLLGFHGIHHLHISDETGEYGRRKRTEHVLFIAFQPDDAYLIGIYPHERDGANWAEKAILEVLVRNWEGAGVLFASQYAIGLTREFDDADRLELQKAGMGLMVMIDGRVWSSVGGTIPRAAQRIGMAVPWELYKLRQAGEEALLEELRGLSDARWVPAVIGGWYGFYAKGADGLRWYGTLDPA